MSILSLIVCGSLPFLAYKEAHDIHKGLQKFNNKRIEKRNYKNITKEDYDGLKNDILKALIFIGSVVFGTLVLLKLIFP